MAYVDYSSHWVLDQFLTYLEANVLGSNDEHLYDTIAVEHNINTTTIDGTHKANSILGSYINTTPVSTGSQAIASLATWTPTVGVYQIVDINTAGTIQISLSLFISAAWKSSAAIGVNSFWGLGGIMFFDGTNMRLYNAGADPGTVWYQKF